MGSLLTHTAGAFRGGIFDDSKVIMFDFTRGESIKGVIINKKIQTGQRIGGPVGLGMTIEQSEKIILHNIKGIKGAKKVIKGVYWQSSHHSSLDKYRSDPSHKIEDYFGFSSWFEGQLDGEV